MAQDPAYIVEDPYHYYGASRSGQNITYFAQSIRGGRIYWKKVGTGKWDDHHGSYARTARFPGDVYEILDAAMRVAGNIKCDLK